jgi:hypothetical protein
MRVKMGWVLKCWGKGSEYEHEHEHVIVCAFHRGAKTGQVERRWASRFLLVLSFAFTYSLFLPSLVHENSRAVMTYIFKPLP